MRTSNYGISELLQPSLAEREEGRLRDELKKIETEESDIKERINMYEVR